MESGSITADCWVLVIVIGLVGLIMGVMLALVFNTFLPKD